MSNSHQHKVLLLLNLSRASGRNLLSGIMNRMNAVTNWRISIIQVQDHTPAELQALLLAHDYDGIISSEMEIPEVANFLECSDKPLVVLGTRRACIALRKKSLAFVTYDEGAIGACGARFFLSLGKFASYGYVHYTEAPYAYFSFLRKRGFRRTLVAAGYDCMSIGEPGEDPAADLIRLKKGLADLPKPSAVLVGCDKRAIDVVTACNTLGLRIPDDVALLSIDNDEILCQSTVPALTSIDTSIHELGCRAVDELVRLFKRNTTRPRKTILQGHPHVVRRESCVVQAPGLSLAKRASQYIDSHAHEDLRVSDVVAHLGVSRRLADLRFREYNKVSMLEAITTARLAVVKTRLKRTRDTIDDIARSCGFTNTNYLKILFKKHVGTTMSQFRKQA